MESHCIPYLGGGWVPPQALCLGGGYSPLGYSYPPGQTYPPPLDIPIPRRDLVAKLPPRKDMGPEVPTHPTPEKDVRHLWKHYLPTTSIAGDN